MEAAGDGTINPLLNTDGTSRISPSADLERTDGGPVAVTISTGGGGGGAGEEIGHRHTRLVHERGGKRRYTVRVSPATGAEVEMVRQAEKVTRGGAGWTRWRCPDDAAGDVDSAPRWRLAGPVKYSREAGGVIGSIEMELVEV